jgi:hypothetical protein
VLLTIISLCPHRQQSQSLSVFRYQSRSYIKAQNIQSQLAPLQASVRAHTVHQRPLNSLSLLSTRCLQPARLRHAARECSTPSTPRPLALHRALPKMSVSSLAESESPASMGSVTEDKEQDAGNGLNLEGPPFGLEKIYDYISQ